MARKPDPQDTLLLKASVHIIQVSWECVGLVRVPSLTNPTHSKSCMKNPFGAAMRLELTTPTMARLCSTTELRPQFQPLWYSRANAIATVFLNFSNLLPAEASDRHQLETDGFAARSSTCNGASVGKDRGKPSLTVSRFRAVGLAIRTWRRNVSTVKVGRAISSR